MKMYLFLENFKEVRDIMETILSQMVLKINMFISLGKEYTGAVCTSSLSVSLKLFHNNKSKEASWTGRQL